MRVQLLTFVAVSLLGFIDPGRALAQFGGTKKPSDGNAGAPQEKRVSFQMQAVPWGRVLEWLSDHTGLPVMATSIPTGTFSFISPKQTKEPAGYTTAEIIDLLNETLLTQKYLLVRRPNAIQIVPADERIDPSLVPHIDVGELPSRGNTELVSIIVPLGSLGGAESALESRQLMGPFGEVVVLTGSKRVVLRDTAGNLRRIRALLMEDQRPEPAPKLKPKKPAGETPGQEESALGGVDVLEYVRLSQITQVQGQPEAFLRDRLTNKTIRLRLSSGYDQIRVKDAKGAKVVLQAKVVSIEPRDVRFQVADKTYVIHMGESLKEALATPPRPNAKKPAVDEEK